LLGRPLPSDVDLVLEGDAQALAQFLYERGVADYLLRLSTPRRS